MTLGTEQFFDYVTHRLQDIENYKRQEELYKVAFALDEQAYMEKKALRTLIRSKFPAFTMAQKANRELARRAVHAGSAGGGFWKNRKAINDAYGASRINGSQAKATSGLFDATGKLNTNHSMFDEAAGRAYRNTGSNVMEQGTQQLAQEAATLRQRFANARPGTPEYEELVQRMGAIQNEQNSLRSRIGTATDDLSMSRNLRKTERTQARAAKNEFHERNLDQQVLSQQNLAQKDRAAMELLRGQQSQYMANGKNFLEYGSGIQQRLLEAQKALKGTTGAARKDIQNQINQYQKELDAYNHLQRRGYNVSDDVLYMNRNQQGGWELKNSIDDIMHRRGTDAALQARTRQQNSAAQAIKERTPVAESAAKAESAAAEAAGMGRNSLMQMAVPAAIGAAAGGIPAFMAGSSGKEGLEAQNMQLMQALQQVRNNNDSFGNRLLNLFNSDTIFSR